jgi:phosphoglucosamine mutase
MDGCKKNLFGTDGIRKKMGEEPLTPESLLLLGRAIGAWARAKYGEHPVIGMACDTRVSSSYIKATLQSGLLLHGARVYDAGVLPTPALYKIIQSRNQIVGSDRETGQEVGQESAQVRDGVMHCGIMITASHNPYFDNGVKIFDSVTGKLAEGDEQEISELFYAQEKEVRSADETVDIKICPANSVVSQARPAVPYEAFGEVGSARRSPKGEVGCIEGCGRKPFFEFDSQNLGTLTYWHDAQEKYIQAVTSYFKKDFLHGKTIVIDCANGATCAVACAIFASSGAKIHLIGNAPDGININNECGSIYPSALQDAVRQYNADIGFAFDGDGDRITVVNKHGQIKDGDDILAVLLQHPEYKNSKGVVGTIMTNHGLAVFLGSQGCALIRVPVGDKFVTARLQKDNLVLGGEQSGHIIMHDYGPVSDGIFTALRVAQVLADTNNWDMISFTRYPQLLFNIPVCYKKDLADPAIQRIIDEHRKKLDSGRIVVRYSGTENMLRIMVEDRTLEKARIIGELISQILHKELS